MYDVGDEIHISFNVGENEIIMDLTIIAVAKVLPGLDWTFKPYLHSMIVIGYQYAQKYFDPQEITPIQLLIDVKDDANSTEIAKKLKKEYLEIRSATSLDQEIQEELNDPINIFV